MFIYLSLHSKPHLDTGIVNIYIYSISYHRFMKGDDNIIFVFPSKCCCWHDWDCSFFNRNGNPVWLYRFWEFPKKKKTCTKVTVLKSKGNKEVVTKLACLCNWMLRKLHLSGINENRHWSVAWLLLVHQSFVELPLALISDLHLLGIKFIDVLPTLKAFHWSKI